MALKTSRMLSTFLALIMLCLAHAALAQAPATTSPAVKAGAQSTTPTQVAAAKASEKKPIPPKADDLDATMALSLNNVGIDQLVKFLSDTTGKPVLKHKTVNAQITINSPTPVTKRRALELICDTLLMDNIYVVEMDHQLQILPADAIKGLQLKTIGANEDIQMLPDSFSLAQKVYRLQNVGAEDLMNQLKKFIPEAVLSVDPHANTLILTDRISRLKYYDHVIQSLDTANAQDRVIEIIKPKFADAVKLAALIGKVLGQTGGGGDSGRPAQPQMSPEMMMMMGGRSSGGSGGGGSSAPLAITAGNVTIVPDPAMNWLIIACPKKRLDEIRQLVKDFDQDQVVDVQARLIDIHHIDVNAVSNALSQLFPDNANKAEKEQIRVVPTEDGNRLIVLSSEKNYKVVKDLIGNLDTDEAEKKETRTYTVKHIQVQDLAEQLTKLHEEKQTNNFDSWYWGGYGNRNQNTETKPSFVPSPRTNTLMVMARPKDFDFIERMIKELDVEVDPSAFAPKIYQIHNTDATELVKVLETLFKDSSASKGQNDDPWSYRWRSDDKKKGSFESLFGDIRFVVDNITNRVVALASNPKDYETIDKIIKQLDQVDPESTEVMVYTLKYADAIDMADRLNNLFSDGSVQQQNPMNQQQQQQNQNGNNKEDDTKKVAEAVRQVIYPWQSGGREKKDGEKERPINTMIGNVRVVPDTRSNKILIAAPSIYFTTLRTMIESLDQQEPQVFITARIVEMIHGKDRRIGVRWTPDPGSIDPAELEGAVLGLGQLGFIDMIGGGNNLTKIAATNGTANDPVTRAITTERTRGNTVLGADINLTLLIQMLVKNSNSRVLSEPGISVNNNETGNIFFGSEFPFQTNSQVTDVGSLTQGVDYRKVGIKLDITPHINKEGEVVLKAQMENSAIRPGETVNGQIIKDLREFSTELAVESGQTMVIGGILIQNENSIERGVPILGNLPVLKYVFGKKDDTYTVRELVFFITPEVLKDRADDDRILKQSTDRLEDIEEINNKKPKARKE